MPSSVMLGSRPIRSRMRWYSSGLRPCWATSSGVILGSFGITKRFPSAEFPMVYTTAGPANRTPAPTPSVDQAKSAPQLALGDREPLRLGLLGVERRILVPGEG